MIRPLSAFACAVLLAGVAAPRAAAQSEGVGAYLVRGPDVGFTAPDFNLQWASKDTTSLDFGGYGPFKDRGRVIVLAFYPRDFTRTDSLQLSTFRDRYDQLFGPDVVVFGVSVDPVDKHQRFAAKLDLPFRLLSDPDQKVAAAYGSKDTGGINRRTVYVIGRDGKVAWRNLRFNASARASYDELGRAVRAALKR
ncbi:MAG TPA: redoxin domain-containing protein [Gemmatimonadales bacterium]|nr:redoxin domain-containing protein [Gemmatimonadales bacterium]